MYVNSIMVFTGGSVVRNPPANEGDTGDRLSPWVRKIRWERKWQPTPVFLLENPRDRGAWRGTVHGLVESGMTEPKHEQKIVLYGIFLQTANLPQFKVMCLEFIHTGTCRCSSSILMCVVLLAVMENQSKRSLIKLFVQKDTKHSF